MIPMLKSHLSARFIPLWVHPREHLTGGPILKEEIDFYPKTCLIAHSNYTDKLEPTVPQEKPISSFNIGSHVKILLGCTRYTHVRTLKKNQNMGTNIEGGDRFLLGDRWLRFMGVIGMSDETVGNIFDGSGKKS